MATTAVISFQLLSASKLSGNKTSNGSERCSLCLNISLFLGKIHLCGVDSAKGRRKN